MLHANISWQYLVALGPSQNQLYLCRWSCEHVSLHSTCSDMCIDALQDMTEVLSRCYTLKLKWDMDFMHSYTDVTMTIV